MTDVQRFDDFERKCDRSHLGMALSFLFVGIGIGTVTALLVAPKSGRQMRRMLKRKYEDARERIDDITDDAGEFVDRGSKWARGAADDAKSWAKEARSRVVLCGRRTFWAGVFIFADSVPRKLSIKLPLA